MPVVTAVLGLLVAPIGLYGAGVAASGSLGVALADADAASVFAATAALAAAAVGGLLVVVVPGRDAFGVFVTASPARESAVVVAGTVVPLLAVSIPLLVGAAAFLVPAVAGAPGASGAGGALTLVVLASFSTGVACCECALQAWRGRVVGVVGGVAVVAVWSGCGAAAGSPVLGPCAWVGRSLAGLDDAAVAAGWSTALLACALAVWALVVVGRPAPRRRRRRVPLLRVRAGGRATMLAGVAAVLVRRPDLRRAHAVAVTFGLAGVVGARVAGLPEPMPLQLGVATAALGAAAFPLAVPGVLVEGRPTWWQAPCRRSVPWIAVAVSTGALALATAPLLLLEWGARAAVTPSTGPVALVVSLTASVAVVAGAVVPLRRGRPGDQVVSFAAFGIIGVVVAVAAGRVGAWLDDVGTPDALVGLVLAASVVVSAGCAVTVRLGNG